MNDHSVQRVADRRSLHLGVEHDVGGHVDVRRLINISMADSDASSDGWNGGMFGNSVDELLPSSGDEQVNEALGCEHLAHDGAVGGFDELHCVRWEACLRDGVANQPRQRGVGVYRLFAAPQDYGVARLQAQHGDVYCHVGPALIYGPDNSQRDAAFAYLQSVGHGLHLYHLAHRIGEHHDAANVICHALQTVGGQQEAVQECLVETRLLSCLIILLVGLKNLFLSTLQPVGNAQQSVILDLAPSLGKLAGGLLRRLSFDGQFIHCRLHFWRSWFFCVGLRMKWQW